MSGPPFAAQLKGRMPSSSAVVVSNAVAPRGAAMAVVQSSLATWAEATDPRAMPVAAVKRMDRFMDSGRGGGTGGKRGLQVQPF